ncbi:MAG: DUF1684 domain-containing protein [Acidimicrobiales bacterium]
MSSNDFVAQWERWHRDHEKRRARPLGFLAITGLHWLNGDPQRFDDVPGEWLSDGTGVNVALRDDEDLLVNDTHVRGVYRFGDIDEHGDRASFGDAIVEIAQRDQQFMIRPRHPDNVVRTRYTGTPTYAPSEDWIARGTFLPNDTPRSITVGASVEGLENVYESPGDVEFELAGERHRLVAFNDEGPDELFIVFTDLTAGTETYTACRFLTARVANDESVVLDFNRATNPPCAYTDFATCPLPPASNHLSIHVRAGEKSPVSSP